MKLQRYRCHKVVEAGEITRVEPETSSFTVTGSDGLPYAVVRRPDLFSRYIAQPGDYLVRYEGDYLSVSPKAAFEAGYAAIEPEAPSDPVDFAPPL